MSDTPLQEAANAADIRIHSIYQGRHTDPSGWEHFAWLVSLKVGTREESFAFKTGLGHVTRPRRNDMHGMPMPGKATEPRSADVLSCLLSDYSACETTFDDWCAESDQNSDSIKALHTYLECQRAGSRLLRLLGRDLFNQLRELEH